MCRISQQSRSSPSLPHPPGTHIGPESDSIQVPLAARNLPIASMAVLMVMSMSSVVEALMGVAFAMVMMQILMQMFVVVTMGMPMPDALVSVAMAVGVAVSMMEILM